MIKQKEKSSRKMDAYYDWDYDINKSSRRRAKIAYVVAAIALVIGIICLFTLNALTPLKQIQPVVITVDAATGVANVKYNLTEIDMPEQEAINKFFLARYIKLMQGYTYFSHEEDRANVLAMSGGHARRQYLREQSIDNPDSFVNQYKNSYRRIVRINEVVLINNDLAQIRFNTHSDKDDITRYYVATLRFNRVEESVVSLKFLLRNPARIVVTDYKIDGVTL